MVIRTIEMREICVEVPLKKQKKRIEKIKGLFGNEFEIEIVGKQVCVRGDMHNHKKRNKLLDILIGPIKR